MKTHKWLTPVKLLLKIYCQTYFLFLEMRDRERDASVHLVYITFFLFYPHTQKAAYTTVANWVVEPASASFFVLPHKNEEIKINTAQHSKIAQEKRSTTTVDEPNLEPESNQTTDQQCKQHINNADYSLLLSFSHHCCVKCEEKNRIRLTKEVEWHILLSSAHDLWTLHIRMWMIF